MILRFMSELFGLITLSSAGTVRCGVLRLKFLICVFELNNGTRLWQSQTHRGPRGGCWLRNAECSENVKVIVRCRKGDFAPSGLLDPVFFVESRLVSRRAHLAMRISTSNLFQRDALTRRVLVVLIPSAGMLVGF
jgi:hypothetical protein